MRFNIRVRYSDKDSSSSIKLSWLSCNLIHDVGRTVKHLHQNQGLFGFLSLIIDADQAIKSFLTITKYCRVQILRAPKLFPSCYYKSQRILVDSLLIETLNIRSPFCALNNTILFIFLLLYFGCHFLWY